MDILDPNNSYQLSQYFLRLKEPLQTGSGEIVSLNGIFLNIKMAGHTGIGITPPLIRPIYKQLHSRIGLWLNEVLSTKTPENLLLSALELRRTPELQMLIDIAMRDLISTRDAKAFSHTLNPNKEPRRELPLCALLNSPENIQTMLPEIIAANYSAVKLKVGANQNSDISHLQEIRAISKDIRLVLDANGAYGRLHDPTADDPYAEILKILTAFAEYDIEYIEEPIAEMDKLNELAGLSPIPIAVDESCRGINSLDLVEGLTNIQTLIVKPTLFGNLQILLKKVEKLQQLGKRIVVSTAIDGSLGLLVAVHFASILDLGPEDFVGLDIAKLIDKDMYSPPPISNGHIQVPQTIGLIRKIENV